MKEWQQQQQHQQQQKVVQEEKEKSIESSDQTVVQATWSHQKPSTSAETLVVEPNDTIVQAPTIISQQSEVNDGIVSNNPDTSFHQPKEKPKIFESLMGRCGVLSNSAQDKEVPLNISNLHSQLLQELAKAKQCQIVLENSIEDPNGNQAPSPKQLEEEIAKAKRCQYALERIIETTSNMDQFPSVDVNQGEIDDMMSAPELKGSFSISQQEVEAGQPKEYIPPPSFFRSGIPSMVEVTLITPAPDSDLAQAYETNLKNTDNDKKLVSKSRVGIDFWPFTKAANDNDRRREEEQGGFDYDTIQTDDFTVDYTLNTMDDSRLEYLHIKSKKMNKVRFQEDEEEKEREAQAAGCSFINCFGFGGDDDIEERQDGDYRCHEKEANTRENPTPEPALQTNSNECSAASTVSNQVSRKNGPAWIGGGSNNKGAIQEQPVANDFSEISNVSEHVIRSRRALNASDRYEVKNSFDEDKVSSAAPKQNAACDYSAVSDISGSIHRMQEANSVSSGNSGSFVKSYGRHVPSSKKFYGERFASKMGVLMEDESVDTSIDKYMLQPSTSGNTAQMRSIIRQFERSNPAAFGL
jgi:hypothetical protein